MKHIVKIIAKILIVISSTIYSFSQNCSNLNIELKAEIPSECITMTMTMMHDVQDQAYLYVANKEAGLKIYNISNISAPVLAATVPISLLKDLEVISLTQEGDYLYLALGNIFNNSQNSGMAIIDVSNPTLPIVKDVWKLSNSGGGAGIVKVEGDYAYLGAMWNGLIILNVSDKSKITMESQFMPDINYPVKNPPIKSFYNARGMAVKNSLVYLCFDAGGIRIINAMDKKNPKETGRYSNPDYNNVVRAYNNAILDDSLLYVAIDYCGLEVLNIKDTAKIHLIGKWNPYNCPFNNWGKSPIHTNELQLNKKCKQLFVSSGKSDLHVIDISDPTSPDSCNIYGGVDNNIGTWGVGLYKNQIYLSYICSGIPFPSIWTGVKILSYDECISTSLTEKQGIQFNVFPIPATSFITINKLKNSLDQDAKMKISIRNLMGKLVLSKLFDHFNELQSIDISFLKEGMYLLEIDSERGIYQQKIIKATNSK